MSQQKHNIMISATLFREGGGKRIGFSTTRKKFWVNLIRARPTDGRKKIGSKVAGAQQSANFVAHIKYKSLLIHLILVKQC